MADTSACFLLLSLLQLTTVLLLPRSSEMETENNGWLLRMLIGSIHFIIDSSELTRYMEIACMTIMGKRHENEEQQRRIFFLCFHYYDFVTLYVRT